MMGSATLFPSQALQIVVFIIQTLGLCIVTDCLSRAVTRSTNDGLLKNPTCARVFTMLVFVNSWLFVFSNGLLTFGVSLELNSRACSAASRACTVLYGSSKIFMYLFLAEKVHVVWSPKGQNRLSSRMYRFCAFSLALYILPVVVMMTAGFHEFRIGDGSCVFELEHYAAFYLVAYDVFINVFFTALFLWPLFESSRRHALIRRVALRTLCTSVIALTTSTANVLALALLKGDELGWLCLATCSCDIIVNSISLFWVTHCSPKKDDINDSSGEKHHSHLGESKISAIVFRGSSFTKQSGSSSTLGPTTVTTTDSVLALSNPSTDKEMIRHGKTEGFELSPTFIESDKESDSISSSASLEFFEKQPNLDQEEASTSGDSGANYTRRRSLVLFASMPLAASNSDSGPSIHGNHRISTSLGNSVNLPMLIIRGRRESPPSILCKDSSALSFTSKDGRAG